MSIKISKQSILTVVEGGELQNGKIIVPNEVIDEVRNEEAIVFKNIFPQKFIQDFRDLVAKLEFKANNYQDCGIGLPGNMHRIDEMRERELGAKFVQYFSFAFWDRNTPEQAIDFMHTLGQLVNRMRGNPEDDQFDITKDFIFWLNCFHYSPTGFLAKHHAPGAFDYVDLNVPFAETAVFFTKYGVDFEEGGLHLGKRNHDDSVLYHVEPYLDPGDILFFVNDLHHETKMIDPHKEKDLNPLKGRFTAVLTSLAMEIVKNYFNPQTSKAINQKARKDAGLDEV